MPELGGLRPWQENSDSFVTIVTTGSVLSIPERITLRIQDLPRIMLCCFGVIPINRSFLAWAYEYLVLLIASIACGYSALVVVAGEEGLRLMYVRLASSCLGMGGLVSLVALRRQGLHHLLGPHQWLLDSYADNYDFRDVWQKSSLKHFVLALLLWAFGVLIFHIIPDSLIYKADGCTDATLGNRDTRSLSVLTFASNSAILAVVTFCQLHVCCFLELTVDDFCLRFFNDPDFSRAVREWNVVQAMLRRVAATVSGSVLAVHTSILSTLLLTATESFFGDKEYRRCSTLWLLWAISPTTLALSGLFCAASVTEKCSRVPALVNSAAFMDEEDVAEDESALDVDRQYLVQYIVQSEAGFYIYGIRLDSEFVLKVAYVLAILVYAVITQSSLIEG
jgi:hypothetical protein